MDTGILKSSVPRLWSTQLGQAAFAIEPIFNNESRVSGTLPTIHVEFAAPETFSVDISPVKFSVTGLSRDQLIEHAKVAEDRYRNMEAVTEARETLISQVKEKITSPHPQIQTLCLIQDAANYYLNTDQYHNAEHVFQVASASLLIAEKAGLLKTETDVQRILVQSLFHDVGNGTLPESRPTHKGQDELEAAQFFLRECIPESTSGILRPGGRRTIENISPSDRLSVVASILGTVFADRPATLDGLSNQPYIKEMAEFIRNEHTKLGISEADISDFAQRVGIVTKKPLQNLEEVLARAALGAEALVLKHADLLPSFQIENAFKGHITNTFEDRQKPWFSSIATASQYFNGFLGFLKAGSEQPVLFGLGAEVALLGSEPFAKMTDYMQAALRDNSKVFSTLFDLIKNQNFNVPGASIGDLCNLLEISLPAKYSDQKDVTFAAAPGRVLNEIFLNQASK